MELEEKQESTSPLPVLPRLDRLDRLLQLLEEKHSFSEKHFPKPEIGTAEAGDQCKRLSNALLEVQYKGTLMERLEMLEERVLKLSLDMDELNTSKSSTSSTLLVSEKFGLSSGLSSVTKEDQDATSNTLQGRGDPLIIQEETSAQAPATNSENRHNNSRKQKTKSGKKWRCWFRTRC